MKSGGGGRRAEPLLASRGAAPAGTESGRGRTCSPPEPLTQRPTPETLSKHRIRMWPNVLTPTEPFAVQGYLAHTKTLLLGPYGRTIQGPMMVLGGVVVSYEGGTPVAWGHSKYL